MTATSAPSYHRPALARELLGNPQLHFLPEADGIRVILYGWRLAKHGLRPTENGGRTHMRALYMEATNGALAYVLDTDLKSTEVYHEATFEELWKYVHEAFVTRPSELPPFIELAAQAIERWPYLALEVTDNLDYDVVTLATLYSPKQEA